MPPLLRRGTVNLPGTNNSINSINSTSNASHTRKSPLHPMVQACLGKQGLTILLMLIACWFGFLIRSHGHIADSNLSRNHDAHVPPGHPLHPQYSRSSSSSRASAFPTTKTSSSLPQGFQNVLLRAQQRNGHCRDLQKDDFSGYDLSDEVKLGNETIASLPAFGIIETLQQWNPDTVPVNTATTAATAADENKKWQCVLPPDNECSETQFTVVFMAYNPDRLGKTLKEIRKLLEKPEWQGLVKEIVMVWNGPRHVDESEQGQKFLEYAKDHPVRVVYPLKMGFPNDLMNRYHPDVVKVTTKAILFYDDDGPFYPHAAVNAGFELWKRHSNAQVGAMARQIDYSKRQTAEHKNTLSTLTAKPEEQDRFFVSHCTNMKDQVDYNFRYFANFDANMVLPSGSFLHSSYLCFLWHPVLAPIRKFVQLHPVHPDDVTVSMVVSQLGGRAPRVYSRRCQPQDPVVAAEVIVSDKSNTNSAVVVKDKKSRLKRRRLLEGHEHEHDYNDDYDEEEEEEDEWTGIIPLSEQQGRRQLLFGIDWDAGAGMNDAKKYWAALRAEAVNALVQYFGSINSGSIGWCYGTEYYNEKVPGKCQPVMARQGWLPWMNPDHTPKATCP
jgi:hypothetical protein